MKIKNLLITLGLASIAGVGWYVVNEDGQEAPAYIPRSDFNNAAAGAFGAFEYYESIKANIYTGKIEKEDVLKMQKALKKVKLPQAKNDQIEWESMGPNNVGGRTRAILPLSDSPNSLLAGGVSGGVFKSTNGAQSWTVLEGFDPYLIVSSMAQLGNGAIYVATGNSRESSGGSGSSGFIGRGLFVSEDDGITWNLVSDFEPDPYSVNSNWANIDVIKSDPVDPDKLWIGNNFGLFPYMHGSTELGDEPEGINISGNVKDLDISADGQTIVTVMANRLYISQDGGENFTHINCGNNCPTGFPSSGFGTAEIAISQNNSDIIFISLAQTNGFLRGVYASVNGGDNWSIIAPQSDLGGQISQFAPFYNSLTAQGWYDNMITSIPSDEVEQVILGGIRMWRWELAGTTPGITSWEAVNFNFASFPGGPPSPLYVHSDIHTDAWDALGRLYTGTDGGVFRSDDNGVTWASLNKDYVTTQFYAIAFNTFGQVLGGLQDNGSLWLNLEGINPKFANQFSGGDGFSCEISQYFPDYMFSTLYNGVIFRSTNGGGDVTPMLNLTTVSAGGGNDFNTDIALYENPNNENSEVLVEYSPAETSPWLEYYPEETIVLSDDGDTIIARIPANTTIQIEADNNDYLLDYTTSEDINFYSYYVRQIGGEDVEFFDVADTVFVLEKPQFMLAAALSNGVYITRQPYKTNGIPQFYKVDDNTPSIPSSVEWSPDGDHLYVGYTNGQLVRLSNFNDAWTEDALKFDSDEYALTRTVIFSGGSSALTDIEVDFSEGRGDNASERVVISLGGYGGSGKIRVSDEAASAEGAGTFEDVWNVPSEFLGMPAYSVVMDIVDPSILLAGTEYGVWFSEDNGDTWSEANNGEMVRVPVFDLRQQKVSDDALNSGVVYAGSHGRGVFRTGYLRNSLSTEDVADNVPVLNKLTVFPNPVTSQASVSFDLGTTADIEMYIYSIDGRLIEAFQEQRVGAGFSRQIDFDASDYAIGQYILQLKVGEDWNSAKFVVTH